MLAIFDGDIGQGLIEELVGDFPEGDRASNVARFLPLK